MLYKCNVFIGQICVVIFEKMANGKKGMRTESGTLKFANLNDGTKSWMVHWLRLQKFKKRNLALTSDIASLSICTPQNPTDFLN